jgi:hypothetical protein
MEGFSAVTPELIADERKQAIVNIDPTSSSILPPHWRTKRSSAIDVRSSSPSSRIRLSPIASAACIASMRRSLVFGVQWH